MMNCRDNNIVFGMYLVLGLPDSDYLTAMLDIIGM